MPRFLSLALVTLCLTLIFAPETVPAEPPVVRIGMVADGPSPLMDEVARRFQKEIVELTRGEMDIRFPAKSRVDGAWSVAGVKGAVDQLLADPNVDVVIALSVIGSNDLARRKRLPKPVIAPFIIDAELQGLPLRKGASGVRNLNYLASFKSIERDVKAFTEIIPFSHLTILVDRRIFEAFPLLRRKTAQISRANKITVINLPVDTSIVPALKALPKETEAVFVTPLLRIPPSEFKTLVSGLIARRLPSFSLWGRKEVERGLLATMSPDTDLPRLARRVALNVQRILLGKDAGKLSVRFSQGDRLTINMATARAIQKWPSFRVLTEAELLNEDVEAASRRLSLYRVIREAVSVNLDLAAADRRVEAGVGEVRQARSSLLPQIDIGTQGRVIDDDRAASSLGSQPEQSAVATGRVEQLIYSDDAWSNFTVQKRTQQSREYERRQLQLDIAQEAGIAYLNVLRSKTSLRIQRDDLNLTRSNLELARVRESVGAAARDEVFRWESEVANSRIAVLDVQAQLGQAKVALNRVLYRPLEEIFQTEEAGMDDPLLLTSEERLFAYVDNPLSFKLFRGFQVEEGLKASPELRRVDALIAAQERRVLNAQRSFWLPDVTLESEVNQSYARGGSGQGPPSALSSLGAGLSQDNTQWSVGIGLSFPLFEGGAKDATQLRTSEELRQLRLEREATVGRVEERIRSALFQVGSSHPSIRLSRQAAEAARKNLGLVRDQYSRGTVDITKLLDAQNAALAANETAANAVYVFLIDLVNIQRAVGQFDYFMYAEEREAWFQRLQAFFTKAGVTPFQKKKSHPTP